MGREEGEMGKGGGGGGGGDEGARVCIFLSQGSIQFLLGKGNGMHKQCI